MVAFTWEQTQSEGNTVAPRFYFEVLASALHDRDALNESLGHVLTHLVEIGGMMGTASSSMSTPYLLIVGTGGTEDQILDRWTARQIANGMEPALLVAHKTDNSLPAALETLAAIHQRRGRGRIIMADQIDEIWQAVEDQAAFLALRSSRIGVVGEPSDWLVASSPPAAIVRERWGPTLVPLATTSLLEAPGDTEVAVELGRRWRERDASRSIPAAEVRLAASLHQPLVALIEERDLDAVTVRCFDVLGPVQTSGCVALAELNDTGVVAGCEGDVVSTVTMMWARELLHTASWMANPSDIDTETGEMLLAHCTVAPSLVTDVALATHFESGLGVGIAGTFDEQPVTLVRLGGRDLDQAWIVDGDITASGHAPHLCRTQVTVAAEPDAVAQVLDRPLGNHIVVIPGHHAARLQAWWQLYIG